MMNTLLDSEPIIETTGINAERLMLLADHIEHHPIEFSMDEWRGYLVFGRWVSDLKLWGWLGCGTTHCIAGLARSVWSSGDGVSTPAIAQQLLGLTYVQANRLFYVERWPEPYASRYSAPQFSESNAWIAAERIRHFVTTDGAE